jgi:AcrR family transcriptional regulator
VTAARLNRMRVLDATLALASERGLAAVTMRAVAEQLGVTPMALYRHVGDKQGLLDALVERLLLEIPAPDPAQDWREQLHGMAQSLRDTAKRHPELFILLFQRPATTRAATGPRNAIYQALRAAGVPEEKLKQTERLLSTFMLGFAASEAGGRFRGVDTDTDMAALEDLIASYITSCAQEPQSLTPAH